MSPLSPGPTPSRESATGIRALRRLAGGLALLCSLSAPALAPAADAAASPAPPGKTVAPVPIRTVAPDHPPELRQKLINGEALLEFLVDTGGEVRDVKIVSETHEGFGAAAEEAVLQWKFKPGTSDGQPKAVRIVLPFEFRLSADQVLTTLAGRQIFAEITETVIPAQQMPEWPQPLEYYVPRYPPELVGSGKYGKAVINITIDKEGRVMNPRLVKATYPEFIMPSLATAAKLRFPPQEMADGKKIYVNMDIQFDFQAPPAKKPAKDAADGSPKKK